MSRAMKRHHRERLKVNRRWYWGLDRDLRAEDEKYLGQAVNTPAPCSCPMCGNERKYWGNLTIQERKAAEAAQIGEQQ